MCQLLAGAKGGGGAPQKQARRTSCSCFRRGSERGYRRAVGGACGTGAVREEQSDRSREEKSERSRRWNRFWRGWNIEQSYRVQHRSVVGVLRFCMHKFVSFVAICTQRRDGQEHACVLTIYVYTPLPLLPKETGTSAWDRARQTFALTRPEELLDDLHDLKYIGAGGYGKVFKVWR